MFSGIDLYSDTATRPSLGMKEAMMNAAVGDEQQGEDPTTIELENLMAKKLGKSAAMFFPSATMCNQIAVFMHTRPGQEVLASADCHIFNSEGGALAFHSRVQPRFVKSEGGIFTADDVKEALRFGIGPHSPRASLLVVENTTNAGGGQAWPLSELDAVVSMAKACDLKTHLDGSRLVNAAIALKTDLARLSQAFDSVTICFSKGLGCGVGAILAFDEVDRREVRRLKQIFGGALRQSGMLAAACLYALEHHLKDLADDHRRAKSLAQGLARIPGINVENSEPMTNILYFSLETSKYDPESFLKACKERGLRFSRFKANRFRAVTHRDIDDQQISEALRIVQTLLA